VIRIRVAYQRIIQRIKEGGAARRRRHWRLTTHIISPDTMNSPATIATKICGNTITITPKRINNTPVNMIRLLLTYLIKISIDETEKVEYP